MFALSNGGSKRIAKTHIPPPPELVAERLDMALAEGAQSFLIGAGVGVDTVAIDTSPIMRSAS